MKFPVDAPKKKVLGAFRVPGFLLVREANHLILERTNSDGTKTPLVLPNHATIKSSTPRSAVTQAGIDRSDFLRAYADI